MAFLECDDFKKHWQETLAKLDSNTERVFLRILDFMAMRLMFVINECESPIEMQLLIPFEFARDYCKALADNGDYEIIPQKVIDCGNISYRVDFLIEALFRGKYKRLVIECDGHDFHEKTKKQAMKDRKRDRDLTLKGYTVIRFTGSEIYNNPEWCVYEALNIVFDGCFVHL